MKTPNFPSFFKKTQANKFDYKARYFTKKKENRKRINFNRSHDLKTSKGRNKRIIFIIIVLSLFTYYFLK